MVDRIIGDQDNTDLLSQELAYKTNTGLWLWGLLHQAEKQGGSVTISIPSLGVETNLTTADIKAAQERLRSKK